LVETAKKFSEHNAKKLNFRYGVEIVKNRYDFNQL